MAKRHLFSKINFIMLSLAVVAGIVAIIIAGQRAERRLVLEEKLGGQVEVESPSPLSVPQYNVLKKLRNNRISLVIDMEMPLQLEKGGYTSHVRVVGDNYPLRGAMQLDPPDLADLFTSDKKNDLYGVVVNLAFLDETGLAINDVFHIGDTSYQIRGLVNSLPDISGQGLLEAGPLVLMRYQDVTALTMAKYSFRQQYRYRAISDAFSSLAIKQRYSKEFPEFYEKATIRRWDDE